MIQSVGFVCFQVTVIAMVAWLINRTVMRNRAASMRHTVWLCAILAMGVVIPAACFGPCLTLNVPGWIVLESESIPQEAIGSIVLESPPRTMANFDDDENVRISGPFSPPIETEPRSIRLATNDATTQPATATSRGWSVQGIVVTAYLCGLAWMVSRMFVASYRQRRIARTATKLDADCRMLVDRCVGKLRLSRVPRVLVSPSVSTPMVFGIFRPCVLLPSSYVNWPAQRQESVLLHELAHVSRHDAFSDFVSQCVTACYWFHPLVHGSLRSMRREREEATDERVVDSGVSALDYARHLVSVLEDVQCSRYSLGGIAMSQYGDMEMRVKKILRLQSEVPRSSRFLCFVAACAFATISATSVRLASAQNKSANPPITIETQTDDPAVRSQVTTSDNTSKSTVSSNDESRPGAPSGGSSETTLAQAKPPIQTNSGKTFFEILNSTPLVTERDRDTLINVSGTVVSSDGQPAADAVVVLRQSNARSGDYSSRVVDVLARTKTDATGKFQFSDVQNRYDLLPQRPTWEVVAATPGQVGWQSIGASPSNQSLRVTLHQTSTIDGSFVTPDGNPIPNARVAVTMIVEPRPDDYWNESLYWLHIYNSILRPETTTDENGRFVIEGLPRNYLANIWIQHPGWADHFASIRTSESVALGQRFPDREPSSAGREIVASGIVHRAQVGFPVTGKVRDEQGSPVENCNVRMAAYVMSTKTDKNGEYTLRLQPDAFERRGKPVDEVKVSLFPPVESGLLGKQTTITKHQVTNAEPLGHVLEKGFEIRGSVLTTDKHPIQGVYLRAVPSEFLSRKDPNQKVRTASAVTRKDGTFKLLVPNAGRYHLLAWGALPNYAMPDRISSYRSFPSWGPLQQVNVLPDAPTRAPPIIVPDAPRVSVRCIDENGQPVPGATVQMVHRMPPVGKSWTRDEELTERMTTDKTGKALLRPARLIASNVVLKAIVDEGDQHLWAETTLPSNLTSGEHQVVMYPMWRITGQSTLDGAPMPGVNVMVWRNPPNRYAMGSHSMSGVPKRVDENGHYEWFVPPNGTYSVELWSVKGLPRNNPSTRVPVERVGPGEYRAEDFRFQMAHGTISGKVLDTMGQPIAGASISSHPQFTDGNRLLLANPSPNTRRATSNDDGTFQIDGLPDGNYQLSAFVRSNPKTHYSTTANAKVGDEGLVLRLVPVKNVKVSSAN